jgi:hypothetical protein
MTKFKYSNSGKLHSVLFDFAYRPLWAEVPLLSDNFFT